MWSMTPTEELSLELTATQGGPVSTWSSQCKPGPANKHGTNLLYTRCSHTLLGAQLIFNQITTHHSLKAAPNSALAGHLSCPKPAIPKEAAVCAARAIQTLCGISGSASCSPACTKAAVASWSQSAVHQCRGEQVPTHQFTAHFLTWARQALTLPWWLSFPMPIQRWLMSTDGEEHGLMEGTADLCQCMTSLRKAFSFLWPFPQLSSHSLVPTHLPDRRLGEGPGQACQQLLLRASVPISLMDRDLSQPGDAHCWDLQL